jgi:hypothetical protein
MFAHIQNIFSDGGCQDISRKHNGRCYLIMLKKELLNFKNTFKIKIVSKKYLKE